MKLRNLLQGWVDCPPEWDRALSGLTQHSQHVQPGDLFIATLGPSGEGRRFIEDAIFKGACAILCEANGAEAFDFTVFAPIPCLPIANLKTVIEEIAIKFY